MSRAALDALTDVVLAYHPPKRIKPKKTRQRASTPSNFSGRTRKGPVAKDQRT